jgi:Uma2 family endonuclease
MRVQEAAERYKYTDYAALDNDKRYELIDGVLHLMSSPSETHQRVSRKLLVHLANHLDGKPCEVFSAPFDVCLNAAGDNDNTVVQPDIMIICDKNKLDGKRCNGAPDMIIEILSPSSTGRDMLIKYKKYQEAGVREYWIADPENKAVYVNILDNGEYALYEFRDNSSIPVHILDGCEISIEHIFAVG